MAKRPDAERDPATSISMYARRGDFGVENQLERSGEPWHVRAVEILEAPHHYDRLIRYAAGCIRGCRLKDVDPGVEPEDLVHDALVVMLEGRLNWQDDIDETLNCLITTIGNEFRNLRRKATRRADPAWQSRLKRECEPGDAEEAHVIRIDVQKSVAQLPSSLREAVVACLLEDEHPTQYATAIARSPTTVRNVIGSAKAALRTSLAGYRFT